MGDNKLNPPVSFQKFRIGHWGTRCVSFQAPHLLHGICVAICVSQSLTRPGRFRAQPVLYADSAKRTAQYTDCRIHTKEAGGVSVEVTMPKWGLTMEEGVVSKWFKKPGDAVQKGEPLFEVETEKITNTVEAPASGILYQIVVEAGSKVPVGTVLAVLAEPGETPAPVEAGRCRRPGQGQGRSSRSRCQGQTGQAGQEGVQTLQPGGPPPGQGTGRGPVFGGRHRPQRPHHRKGCPEIPRGRPAPAQGHAPGPADRQGQGGGPEPG